MKAFRPCPACGELCHARKQVCPKCNHAFVKKGVAPAVQSQPAESDVIVKDGVSETKVPAAAKTPKSRAAVHPMEPDKVGERFERMQNYIAVLEKQVDIMTKKMEDFVKLSDTRWRKFYNFQAQLIYQRAYNYFGGQGELIYNAAHEHLFKEQSDETGAFIAPVIPEPENLGGEPTDENKQEVIGQILTLRHPVEKDLDNEGMTVEDAMSIDYANLVPKAPPSVACAVEHVKYIVQSLNAAGQNS